MILVGSLSVNVLVIAGTVLQCRGVWGDGSPPASFGPCPFGQARLPGEATEFAHPARCGTMALLAFILPPRRLLSLSVGLALDDEFIG